MTIPFLKKMVDLYHFNKRSFVAFCLVGLCCVLLYIGLYALFDKILALGHILALNLSFVLTASFQFFANRFFSFQSTGQKYTKDILKYCVLLMVNYLMSVLFVLIAIWIHQPPIYGVLIVSVISPFTSYILFRYWIFPTLLSENL